MFTATFTPIREFNEAEWSLVVAFTRSLVADVNRLLGRPFIVGPGGTPARVDDDAIAVYCGSGTALLLPRSASIRGVAFNEDTPTNVFCHEHAYSTVVVAILTAAAVAAPGALQFKPSDRSDAVESGVRLARLVAGRYLPELAERMF